MSKTKQKLAAEPIVATIDKLVPGGQGLATLKDGKKAFIWNALPNEEVEFILTKSKTSYCEGIASNILKASPERVEPKDDCFLSTSPWQIMNFDYELRQKAVLVQECFRQQKLELRVLPCLSDGKEYGYRNKMEYSLYWNKESELIELGFHARGQHKKIPVRTSSIERPELFAYAQKIIAELNAHHAEARDFQSLLLRCNQEGEVSGDLFVNGRPHPEIPSLSDKLLGKEYHYSPNGFFQINLPVYEMALKLIADKINTQRVLDLYAGVGSIGLSVARDRELTLVEINASAFEEMQNNAKGLDNAHCILDKSENVAGYITPDCTVILDPPRAGCEASLIDTISQVQPKTVIYLSCNPITQARDIALLADQYEIDPLQPLNFFPHTPHIENLAILHRK